MQQRHLLPERNFKVSIENYAKAVELMRSHPRLCDFLGPCSEDLVRQAEQKLNLKFPETYRQFLLEYGAGSFGAEQIYGVFKENFENSQTPDAVWFTLTTRREVEFPNSYIIIYGVGDGEVFCIKTEGQFLTKLLHSCQAHLSQYKELK